MRILQAAYTLNQRLKSSFGNAEYKAREAGGSRTCGPSMSFGVQRDLSHWILIYSVDLGLWWQLGYPEG